MRRREGGGFDGYEGIALGRAEGRTEGRAEGERMAKKEMVFSLAEIELPVERIAELVKVSVQLYVYLFG